VAILLNYFRGSTLKRIKTPNKDLGKKQQSLGPGIILVEASQYSVGQQLAKKCTCCAYTLLMWLS
jgi:hypothetical protein